MFDNALFRGLLRSFQRDWGSILVILSQVSCSMLGQRIWQYFDSVATIEITSCDAQDTIWCQQWNWD